MSGNVVPLRSGRKIQSEVIAHVWTELTVSGYQLENDPLAARAKITEALQAFKAQIDRVYQNQTWVRMPEVRTEYSESDRKLHVRIQGAVLIERVSL